MKTITLISLWVIAFAISGVAQDANKKLIPSIEIKDLEGQMFNTAAIDNEGKPIILSFWATWCKPCIKELTTISEVYADWQEETGVKLIAISIDDARYMSKVQPLVMGNDWQYEVLLDANQDFKRAMNVNMIPHTFVLNGNKEIVWQHTSFAEGGELELIDIVRKVIAGEEIGH